MRITTTEAAALMGKSPRAVRAAITSGQLQARRQGTTWLIDTNDLPLTAAQRARIEARAEKIHSVVDAALPDRSASRSTRPRRAIADLDVWRTARDLLWALEREAGGIFTPRALATAVAHGQRALTMLGEGIHEYDRSRKATSLRAARRGFARAIASGLAIAGLPSGARKTLERLEQEVQPRLGGLLRWAAQGNSPRHPERAPRR